MKILYISNQRLPTEKAYGIQIAKMCEAFVETGARLTLVFPTRKNLIKKDFFDYYGIGRNFRIKKIFSFDFYLPGKLDRFAFYIKNLLSVFVLVLYALNHKSDIIYSRDELPLYLLSFFKKNLVFEIHKFSVKKKMFYRRFKKLDLKIVAISKGVKAEFLKIGFKEENMIIAHDGVDLKEFDIKISKTEARKKLDLPLDKNIVVYSGHLFKWKGAGTLAEAALLLKDRLFVFIGGVEKDVRRFRDLVRCHNAENILFLGHKPHNEVSFYLKAADILVLPNEKEDKVSEFYTSPLKLFEYMASGRPIIASDLPSIRDVLDEDSALFFKPGNSGDLAEKIKKIAEDFGLADKISSEAFEKVKDYTWTERSKKILGFIV